MENKKASVQLAFFILLVSAKSMADYQTIYLLPLSTSSL